jgi:4-hydroxymandelate oxidase
VSRFVDGLEQRAAEVLPEPVYRYVRQGSRDGVTAAEAALAWDRFRFLPQVMRDVTDVQTGTSLLGAPVTTPLAVAPTTMQRAAHPDGEVAMARAAAETGALMVVSSNAGSTFEDIAATGVDWWLQLYVTAERHTGVPLLERAVGSGARAVVLTVDTPVVGTKYAGGGPSVWDIAEPGWVRANFPAEYGSAPGDEKATDLGPQDVDWLAKATGLPVVVKGVLRPADARRCLDAGASAVWVSNHGGRQLDYSAATADRLASVVAEVGSSTEVYVDGGVRNGRHALTALALGARGVFLGRLPLYALAVAGTDGVRRMFEELRDELVDALMLAGCPSVTRVPPDLLTSAATRQGGPYPP